MTPLLKRPPLWIALLAFAVATTTAALTLRSQSHEHLYPDSVAYRFQAKLFAQGDLSAPILPERRLLPSAHLCIHNGRTMAKYPPGFPLLLAPAEWLGAPWLIPSLATGLTVWLVFLFTRDMFGSRTAIAAALFLALSPATVALGMTVLSEVAGRALLAAYVLGLVRWTMGRGLGYALLTGLALGWEFNTRPLTAVAFGLVGGFFWLYVFIKGTPMMSPPHGGGDKGVGLPLPQTNQRVAIRRRLLTGLAPATLGFGLFFALFLGWNDMHNGNPWSPSFSDQTPHDKIGFGVRYEAMTVLDDDTDHLYTPADAIHRTFLRTLPAIACYASGWGVYHIHIEETWDVNVKEAMSYILYTCIYTAICATILARSANRYDRLLFAFFAASVAAYSLHFYDQVLAHSNVFGVRYHAEAIAVALIPLLIRSSITAWGWITRDHAPKLFKHALLAIAAGAAVYGTTTQWWDGVQAVSRRLEAKAQLPQLVEKAALQHAVVYYDFFDDTGVSLPFTDYPFVSLEKANVVFCRSGHMYYWNIPDESWQEIHLRLFPDRDPWLFTTRNGPPRLERLHLNQR